MAYIGKDGQVVHGSGPALGLRAILRFIQGIINFVLFFFRTILNPTAADDYAARNRRGGGGGSGGGGGPRPPRGARFTGLGDLRDASGCERCAFVSCLAASTAGLIKEFLTCCRPGWACY
ncbi:hypothetical protein ABPG75_009745 [Micractinium tetrahymenae]